MQRIERRTLDIEAAGFRLPGSLWMPHSARGIVVGLQPGELDRLMPRDGALLERLCDHGFATLAVGLLTSEEESCVELATTRRFDIQELAQRALGVLDWVSAHGVRAPLGFVAKGTAAAAALAAALRRPQVGAVVSIAGRPDLAVYTLASLTTPTLLLVGSGNEPNIHHNQLAVDHLRCPHELHFIPGSGSLERSTEAELAGTLALEWFEHHLASPRKPLPARGRSPRPGPKEA